MIPRRRLDIGWSDLLAALAWGLRSGEGERARQRLEQAWDDSDGALAVACLSVRTGWDLVLSALALPPGSEVVFSALTIRDMVRIAEEHGLVPVPVDLDTQRLAVDAAELERVITPATRVVVIAHLFGSRMPLDEIADLCRRRGILLVEDCAQAFTGGEDRGHVAADVRMFSFGPIKTNTALGGALLSFRDAGLASMVRRREASLAPQSRVVFMARVAKYAVLKLLLLPMVFTLFVYSCRFLGRNHDRVICGAVRGFAGSDFLSRIRRRPSVPLMALLARRLARFDSRVIQARKRIAAASLERLPAVTRPGSDAANHSHWVFPIQVADPERLVRRMWDAGLDATRGASNMHAVEPPPDRPQVAPRRAAAMMREIVYLPIYPGVSRHHLRRLAEQLEQFVGDQTHAVTLPADPSVASLPARAPVAEI